MFHFRFTFFLVLQGPAPALQSYLNQDALLKAVLSTGAQAVHPGYGFVSENPAFAKKLEDVGVAFVGPPSSAILRMGDKIESKGLARSAGVSTVPGLTSDVHGDQELLKACHDIGYPVMVKASAGGGGKGMRVAFNDAEALEAFRLCKAEIMSSFGNDRMFVEKYIQQPRHVEIQILGDRHGNVVYFPERECSIQRRNQKVVEEAPSVAVNDAVRRKMGEQAASLARTTGYFSAGTCEFLVDQDMNFYFLEMNTRLQVEHPITEFIVKQDFVAHMLRIAAGYPLSIRQKDIPVAGIGHAIETRVYAEDPFRNFLPSIGILQQYSEPQHRFPEKIDKIRVDTGVEEGSEISIYYDPLISKTITYGSDREEARKLMVDVLDAYVVRGLQHNIPLLRDVLNSKRFTKGKLSTKFLEEEYPNGFQINRPMSTRQLRECTVAASALNLIALHRDLTQSAGQLTTVVEPTTEDFVVTVGNGPEDANWAVTPVRVERLPSDIRGRVAGGMNESEEEEKKDRQDDDNSELEEGDPWDVEADSRGGLDTYFVTLDPPAKPVDPTKPRWLAQAGAVGADVEQMPDVGTVAEIQTLWQVGLPIIDLKLDGKRMRMQVVKKTSDGFRLQHEGHYLDVRVHSPDQHRLMQFMKSKPRVDNSRSILSPMPGKIVSVAVKPGDSVVIGQEVAVVEAMKMQNVLRAPRDGVVKAIPAKVGGNVAADEIVVQFQ